MNSAPCQVHSIFFFFLFSRGLQISTSLNGQQRKTVFQELISRKEEKLLSNRRSQEIEQYHRTTQQLTVSDTFPWLFIVSESELGTHSPRGVPLDRKDRDPAVSCVTCASIGARNDWHRQMSQLRCLSCNQNTNGRQTTGLIYATTDVSFVVQL